MAKRKVWILVAVFVVLIVGVLVYSTLNLAQYKVEVCIAFNGRTQCRTAAGVTEENALRAARSVACATLANEIGRASCRERV